MNLLSRFHDFLYTFRKHRLENQIARAEIHYARLCGDLRELMDAHDLETERKLRVAVDTRHFGD